MVRTASRLAGLLSVALLAACQARGTGAAEVAPAHRTIRDGVYTEMQARYGASVFNASCSRCHSRSEWQHESFLRSWSGKTVEDLFARIYETMPRGEPASLSLQEYADVVAYLFRLNDLPTGEVELGTEEAALRAILIEPAAAP